jgi:hypothetical protein
MRSSRLRGRAIDERGGATTGGGCQADRYNSAGTVVAGVPRLHRQQDNQCQRNHQPPHPHNHSQLPLTAVRASRVAWISADCRCGSSPTGRCRSAATESRFLAGADRLAGRHRPIARHTSCTSATLLGAARSKAPKSPYPDMSGRRPRPSSVQHAICCAPILPAAWSKSPGPQAQGCCQTYVSDQSPLPL